MGLGFSKDESEPEPEKSTYAATLGNYGDAPPKVRDAAHVDGWMDGWIGSGIFLWEFCLILERAAGVG